MKDIYITNENGDLEKVTVSEEVADLLESFRREDETEKRKERRRIKKHGGPNISYEEWMGSYEFETQLISNMDLKNALTKLTDKQKSRLLEYYLMGFTYSEIADSGYQFTRQKKIFLQTRMIVIKQICVNTYFHTLKARL